MAEIRLQLLDTPAGQTFDRQVARYTQHVSEYVLRFPQLVERIKKSGEDSGYFERYGVYMRWAIRKLEYAFVLDSLVPDDGLKVLDVGSGVTILPHVLSRMGCIVDALDPAPEWKLGTTEIGQLYNSFYDSDVRYINDHVHSIQEDELYDRVTSVSVLEHLARREIGRTLDKMVSLLKPEGRLILTIDYCPRATYSRFKVINWIVPAVRRRLGLHIEAAQGGFSYDDFRTLIYDHLPGRCDLSKLWRQDRLATSYEEFWSSHAFDGCLYRGYRPYLALGICCTKP